MTSPAPIGPDAVADAEWARVRALAEKVARLEAGARERHLSDEERARLDRARAKVARATDRALLADALADHMNDLRPRRRGAPTP